MGIYGQQYRIGLGGGLTPAVKYIILTNIVCFFLQHLIVPESIVRWFTLIPNWVVDKFAIWQLVTYLFLHGDVFHILMNMIILWMFGGELERHWGTKEFTRFYFICGIGAGIVHLLVSMLVINTPMISVIGASGAIYGLLMAYGVLFPNRIITLLLLFVLPINIKAKYLVMIVGLISLFHGLASTQGGVAHFAHLGGMLVGFLYLKLGSQRSYEGLPFKPRSAGRGPFGKWMRQRAESRRKMQIVRRQQQEQRLRERVDAILDKINEVGYENLSEEEKQILKKASQFLSQKNFHSEGLS
jgi:membrane associated rhomboid family serine protease